MTSIPDPRITRLQEQVADLERRVSFLERLLSDELTTPVGHYMPRKEAKP